MMYIEHTNLEDNLHQILTNREPTSSSPSASEATAAVAASALLARVREAQNSTSSALQQQPTSANAQFQNHINNSTPNNHKASLQNWLDRPESSLLPLEHLNSNGLASELREILKTVEKNNTSALKKQVQENHHQSKTEAEEEEQYELVQVVDSDQSAQAENLKTLKLVNNVQQQQQEIRDCASTSHFVINIDSQKIASSVAAPQSQNQIEDDEEFEYIVTRVPKRKLQQSSTSQVFEDYSPFNRKIRRPVPEAIPLDLYSKRNSCGEFQLPQPQNLSFERPVPTRKPFCFTTQDYYKSTGELHGYNADYLEDDENNCDYYSDSETVEAASTGLSAYAHNNNLYSRQEAQMGLDIISKLKDFFRWQPSTNYINTDYQEGKRKRRSDNWSVGETVGPQPIKYRKVENRFPKYIATRPEEDEINEFLPTYLQHNQQPIAQKYGRPYLLNNSAQSSKTLLEMSNRRSSAADKPPLRKSMFSAPHITQQLIKNTTYADVEFSDDDEPILLKGFDLHPSTLAAAKRAPQVFNIPIIRTEERLKSKQQKAHLPPLIEPSTSSILQSSLIPTLNSRRKPTYAETLRQNSGAGHILGDRNSNTPSVASTSHSSRLLNGLNNTRTNPWSTQNRSSILNQEKESEEREKYQQLLEQVVPRLYGSTAAENKFSTASTLNLAAQRRRSALLLGTGLTSSARSSPAANNRSMGLVASFLKRRPLSSTINLDDDDEADDDVTITGVSHLKPPRSVNAKKQSLPITTVIVDDDELSDIIDLGNEERHVLSACAKIQKEKSIINNLCEEKVEKPKKASLPFVEPVNSLRERFNSSPHIKENWLETWQTKWLQRKKNRHDEVKETMKVTEKLTAERRAAEAEIQERLRKFQIVDPELLVVDDFEDVIEEPEFIELTQDHKARINAALHGPLDQVLISKFNLNITRRDIHTLCGHNWLNDEVINFYMNLLTERGEKRHESHGLPKVYAMNTFFVPRLMQAGHAGVKRWTRKVDIFAKHVMPVPVHVGGVHWCMAIIHLKNRSIKYYDSMATPNPSVLKALEQYLKDESMDKRKRTYDTSDFVIESVQGVPRQMNGSDCGVFSCMFAEYITRNRDITFSQQNMEYFRQKMILEIVMGELLQ